MSAFANSYTAFLCAYGSQMHHPSNLKPYSLLAEDQSPLTTYALTFTQCEDMTGMFALRLTRKVIIRHHFLFDMHTPFKPDSSNKFIILTGKHTMDNAIMIDPAVGLAFPNNAPHLRYPSWSMLMAAIKGAAISMIASPTTGPEHRFRPFIPMPAWLAAILMDSGSEDATELCVTAIHAIRDFDTCATNSSPTEAQTVSQEEDDDNGTGDMLDFVAVDTPVDLVQFFAGVTDKVTSSQRSFPTSGQLAGGRTDRLFAGLESHGIKRANFRAVGPSSGR